MKHKCIYILIKIEIFGRIVDNITEKFFDREEKDKGANMSSLQEETSGRTRISIREPRSYQVIMHNDDYTPMEFVVEILVDIFRKDQEMAIALMMKVHKSGSAAVGNYSYDIAQSKVRTAISRARKEGYPFRMTVKEV